MSKAAKAVTTRKKTFSSFRYKEAFKQLNIDDLLAWQIDYIPIQPSDFFQERLKRLQCFDLQSYERSKELLIDAICEEAIQRFVTLKIWKGANLESDSVAGETDYLIAARKAYLEAPFICIIEAKKDDFEQGLAQCLVEMQACQWNNQQVGKDIDVFGVVTNGEGWKFYKLEVQNNVHETVLYSISDLSSVLGVLNFIFQECQRSLS